MNSVKADEVMPIPLSDTTRVVYNILARAEWTSHLRDESNEFIGDPVRSALLVNKGPQNNDHPDFYYTNDNDNVE